MSQHRDSRGRFTARRRHTTRRTHRHYSRRWTYRRGGDTALKPKSHVKGLSLILLAVGGYYLYTKFSGPSVALPAPMPVVQGPQQDNSEAV